MIQDSVLSYLFRSVYKTGVAFKKRFGVKFIIGLLENVIYVLLSQVKIGGNLAVRK